MPHVSARTPRTPWWLAALVLGFGALAGAALASRAESGTEPSEKELRTFAQILAIIEERYAGDLDRDALIESAIQGMLQTLDPHSNYLDPASFKEMREEQQGRFGGLGIQINKPGPDKPLTIIAPIEGTPAHRAGLQSGDTIVRIEGADTAPMPLTEAVRRLRGEKGTPVTITIQRPIEGETFDVTLVRDEIPTHSIRVSYLLQPGVGYIRISNFTSTTTEELDEALRQLREQGMERLILDLRSNPGGLLNQAVEVAERFVPEGKRVVYTRGRIPGSDQDYVASGDVARAQLPLVVLVDRNSASASEIVAGSIQDHDLGLVVGERTFGKGLVQQVIPLRNGGAIALTTAKYYTPSGRLIQRDYSDLDRYFLEAREEAEEDEVLERDAEPQLGEPSSEDVYYTDAGRKVYGGGGIQPDYVVPSARASMLVSRLMRGNFFLDYAVRYADRHPELKEGFRLERAELERFAAFLDERRFAYAPEALERDAEQVLRQIRAAVAKIKWGEIAEARVLAEDDPQIQKALTVFDEAARLAELGRTGRAARGS